MPEKIECMTLSLLAWRKTNLTLFLTDSGIHIIQNSNMLIIVMTFR